MCGGLQIVDLNGQMELRLRTQLFTANNPQQNFQAVKKKKRKNEIKRKQKKR